MVEGQLNDLKLEGPITLSILEVPSEMMDVMGDREVWRVNLELLPPQPTRKAANKKRRRRRTKYVQGKCISREFIRIFFDVLSQGCLV